MTDGTLASRRTTGCRMLRIQVGRELDDEDGDEERRDEGDQTAATPVIRMVLQISGQAWNV